MKPSIVKSLVLDNPQYADVVSSVRHLPTPVTHSSSQQTLVHMDDMTTSATSNVSVQSSPDSMLFQGSTSGSSDSTFCQPFASSVLQPTADHDVSQRKLVSQSVQVAPSVGPMKQSSMMPKPIDHEERSTKSTVSV